MSKNSFQDQARVISYEQVLEYNRQVTTLNQKYAHEISDLQDQNTKLRSDVASLEARLAEERVKAKQVIKGLQLENERLSARLTMFTRDDNDLRDLLLMSKYRDLLRSFLAEPHDS